MILPDDNKGAYDTRNQRRLSGYILNHNIMDNSYGVHTYTAYERQFRE